MHRQLMDAQRLIRIILGKPLNKDQNPLGANSILQAIRSFALMKAELIELRKKQEIIDGDPPAILQTLGSPAVTTPSTARTGACVLRRLDVQSQINDGHKTCEPTDIASPVIVTNTDAPINSDIEQANDTIQQLRKQLQIANNTISELKEKVKSDEVGLERRNTTESTDPNEDVEETIHHHQQNDHVSVEESKQDENLDLLLDEIALIPQQTLTKDAVREKLKLYFHTVNRHTFGIQILEMEEKIRQSQEKSDTRIQEIEQIMKEQDEKYKEQKKVQAGTRDQKFNMDTEAEKNNKQTILMDVSNNPTVNDGTHLPLPKSMPKIDSAS